MKFLYPIIRLESWKLGDKIRNVAIRDVLEQLSAVEQIAKKELKWFGHLIRINEERKWNFNLG